MIHSSDNRIVCSTYSVKAQLTWKHNNQGDKCENYAQSMEYIPPPQSNVTITIAEYRIFL